MENNQNFETNTFTKGLNIDLNPSLMRDDTVTYARNSTLFSQEGDIVFYQTEQGNRKVTDIPYPCIGHIKLPDGTYLLFLTDDVNSEIGVFDPVTYVYTKKKNEYFLNFRKSNLITGASKEGADGSYSVYFSDGRRNPDRIINLSKLANMTADNIRLARLISPPTVSIKKSVNGLLPNGAYQAAIFYSANKQKFGNTYGLTIPIPIFSQNNNTGALEISVSNIDDDFDEFQLVVIQSTKGTTTAKIVGTYPRSTSYVHVSNFDNPVYITVPIEELTTENEIWVASDQMSSNNDYLFRVGVESVPELNYQRALLDNVQSEYVVVQANANYYKEGDKVGHYRDEVYSYFLQPLHKTGKYGSAFFLRGRPAEATDRALAYGKDIYETTIKSCEEEGPFQKWQVENTADRMIGVPHTISDTCSTWEIGHGKMAYYESTDTFPANEIQFGTLAGTPITFHKFPNEDIVPRHELIDGKSYINIMAIRFKNIPAPLKEDGSVDEDWVGYRIIRQDREGNRSVISRGLLANVRSYKDPAISTEDTEILYPNYPYNDLGEDHYLSQTQTAYKNRTETAYEPLRDYKTDTFTFYSPHSTFGRYALGQELVVESEELGSVTGEFTETYNHPPAKLLTQFGFWIAIASGIIESYIIAAGFKNKQVAKETEIDVSVTGGVKTKNTTTTRFNEALDTMTNGAAESIKMALSGDFKAVASIALVLAFILQMGAGLALFTLQALDFANRAIELIYGFLDYRQYALQYNSKVSFDTSAKVKPGSRRRFVKNYKYLENGVQSFENQQVNNFGREESVILKLNASLLKNTVVDNSRVVLSDNGCNMSVRDKTASMYYATSKRRIKNQYGRVENATNFISCHNNVLKFGGDSPIIFGGDCWITRYAQLKKFPLFTQTLANANYPPGTGYDYKLYRNVAYPRFWIDTFKYDFSQLLNKTVVSRTSFSRTTTAKYNLDCKQGDGDSFRIDTGNFYTSVNGVIEFFVESDYNLFFRERRAGENFYSEDNTTLHDIFRSDKLYLPEEFHYDTSLSKKADQVFALPQNTNYDPAVYSTVYKYSKNRLIYSLPASKEQLFDNWRYFLTGNQHEFPRSEFGNFTSMHRVDGERIMFLFDKSSPYITVGKQQLELSDLTVTIGDGGLFAQPPRELMYTEQHYGNSQSRFAAISSQFGTFYVSERQGRLFKFGGGLDEITRKGVYFWSKMFFPIRLTDHYRDYPYGDNIVKGVGYSMSFDNIAEVIYITKKDYVPVPELEDKITWNNEKKTFMYVDAPIEVTNPTYFEDCSFTLSYSPTFDTFVSFHDWVPDWVINGEKAIFSFKNTGIWKHNDDCQNYANYYGVQYPWEVEFAQSNKFKVQTVSSLEYYLESIKYNADCYNQFHVKDDNFDRLIVYNSEQCSGINTMIKTSGNPYNEVTYPKYNGKTMEVLFSKVENRYRVNQFKDLVANRNNGVHVMHTAGNGWVRTPNPRAINYTKNARERKLFRHYDTKILLQKLIPKNKMILKLNLTKGIISPR